MMAGDADSNCVASPTADVTRSGCTILVATLVATVMILLGALGRPRRPGSRSSSSSPVDIVIHGSWQVTDEQGKQMEPQLLEGRA